jgi:2'-5' RNA ligase
MGVSIWAIPEGALGKRLAERIRRAAENAPFDPHVTVLGGIRRAVASVDAVLAEVTRRVAPFSLTLGDRGSDDAFFRCLYLQVDPDQTLLALRSSLVRELGVPSTSFLPHLSLQYASLSSASRDAFLAQPDPERGAQFRVSSLHLWSTKGPVTEWRPLATHDLRGPPSSPANGS